MGTGLIQPTRKHVRATYNLYTDRHHLSLMHAEILHIYSCQSVPRVWDDESLAIQSVDPASANRKEAHWNDEGVVII